MGKDVVATSNEQPVDDIAEDEPENRTGIKQDER